MSAAPGPIAIITGSGTYALPGFELAEVLTVPTPYGPAELSSGSFAGVPAVHVSRHGTGHVRLSNHVTHRSYIWALRKLSARAVIGCTACGAVDPALELGSLIVFGDLWFQSNRLPDGSLCTFFDRPGDPARAHWILHGSPFSTGVQEALRAGADGARVAIRDGGIYGHVDGPRFNTPAEIAALRAIGVVAVSQTGGPETVLCGELELPYALIGYATDYANEVKPGAPTPVSTLVELMGRSSDAFASVLRRAVPGLAAAGAQPAGTVYRFEG